MSARCLRWTIGDGVPANCRGGLRETVATIEDVPSGRDCTRLEVFPPFGAQCAFRTARGPCYESLAWSGRLPRVPVIHSLARRSEHPPSVHVAGPPPRRGARHHHDLHERGPVHPAALRRGELL